jgi:hypothetical protein
MVEKNAKNKASKPDKVLFSEQAAPQEKKREFSKVGQRRNLMLRDKNQMDPALLALPHCPQNPVCLDREKRLVASLRNSSLLPVS